MVDGFSPQKEPRRFGFIWPTIVLYFNIVILATVLFLFLAKLLEIRVDDEFLVWETYFGVPRSNRAATPDDIIMERNVSSSIWQTVRTELLEKNFNNLETGLTSGQCLL